VKIYYEWVPGKDRSEICDSSFMVPPWTAQEKTEKVQMTKD